MDSILRPLNIGLWQPLENIRYAPIFWSGIGIAYSRDKTLTFTNINSILNARKARAGKALEHHLSAIFTANSLAFEEQVITENGKKPDFLFPNGKCYHHFEFPSNKLTILGAKTTCRDRWNQVASEAKRADFKYLFTTQPGMSISQLTSLESLRVGVVVPKQNIETFPKSFQNKIWSLAKFIAMVKEQQATIPSQFLPFLKNNRCKV